MSKGNRVPIHRSEHKFSGVFITPLGAEKTSDAAYAMSEPHRHDFYYCVLLQQGSLELEVDFKKVTVKSGDFYLSYPGQIHQVNRAKLEKGWYLAFEPPFIDEALRNILDQALSEVIVTPLSTQQRFGLEMLAQQLHSIFSNEKQLFQEQITQALLNALVYQAASAYMTAECSGLRSLPARAIEITKEFKRLVRQNFRVIKKPSEFAALMNITSTHLNDTVRSVTGFSVTYLIQNELMREAQRMLSVHGTTVKQVAGALGFEDDKYFNRLFRKVTGTSPGIFKKQLEHPIVHPLA